MTVYKGIDVSKWQGEINWSRVKNSGIQFAMLRSSFGWGASYNDNFFEYNYRNAKDVGIAVGAYHFSYATTPEEAIKSNVNRRCNLKYLINGKSARSQMDKNTYQRYVKRIKERA